MKRLALSGLLAATMALAAPVASADPPESNGHNCRGFITTLGSGPGFGQSVSELAHEQGVDNLPNANCDNNNGKNP